MNHTYNSLREVKPRKYVKHTIGRKVATIATTEKFLIPMNHAVVVLTLTCILKYHTGI